MKQKQTTESQVTQDPPIDESAGSLPRHLVTSIAATIVLTAICCGAYPLIVWGISQAVFPSAANGSLIKKDGTYTSRAEEAAGSELLGQSFSALQYFHPRPSAAGSGYDAANSAGSNLGPLSDKLINGLVQKDDKGKETLAYDGIRLRTLKYALENDITFQASIPLDSFKDENGVLDDVKLVNAFPHPLDAPDKKPLVFTGFSTPIPGDAVTASGSGLDPHVSLANAALQANRVARSRGISPAAVEKLIHENTSYPFLGVLGEAGVNVLKLNLALDASYPSLIKK